MNESGAWRRVVEFDASQREAVLAALPPLARALGGGARWCVLHADGTREWLGTLSEATADFAREAATTGV
ncbi:hypothetical protein [Mizugakiibacter sediminis]|uniref:hypothetical protein n=1 Tax=Mizugakiibacter sediminis TaxID=1475481 RepID=UPI0011E4D5AC|nr:hypothetical protein [Mizugakiibacter sediminis]